MEATRALDSPYSSHCFLDDCVALCWDVWKLSTKTSVEKIWGKYLDQKNSPTWREVRKFSFLFPAATRFELERATLWLNVWYTFAF